MSYKVVNRSRDLVLGPTIEFLKNLVNVAPPGVEEMLKEPGRYEIDAQTGLLVHVHGSNGIDTRVRSCSTISPTFSADSIRLPSYCQSFGRKENIS